MAAPLCHLMSIFNEIIPTDLCCCHYNSAMPLASSIGLYCEQITFDSTPKLAQQGPCGETLVTLPKTLSNPIARFVDPVWSGIPSLLQLVGARLKHFPSGRLAIVVSCFVFCYSWRMPECASGINSKKRNDWQNGQCPAKPSFAVSNFEADDRPCL